MVTSMIISWLTVFLVEYEGKGPTADHSVETPHLLVLRSDEVASFSEQ